MSQDMRVNRVFLSHSLPASGSESGLGVSGSESGLGVGSVSGSLCVSWSVSERVCAR